MTRLGAYGLLFESSLVLVALVLGYLLSQPALADFHLDMWDAGVGVAATVPLLFLFWFSLQSTQGPLFEIKQILETALLPLLKDNSLWFIWALSLAAGVGEEMLFRGVLQGAFSEKFDPLMGLILASVLFGFAHCLNKAYAVVTFVMGIYLGGLWMLSGNLLVPMVTHFLYDALALCMFLKSVKNKQ